MAFDILGNIQQTIEVASAIYSFWTEHRDALKDIQGVQKLSTTSSLAQATLARVSDLLMTDMFVRESIDEIKEQFLQANAMIEKLKSKFSEGSIFKTVKLFFKAPDIREEIEMVSEALESSVEALGKYLTNRVNISIFWAGNIITHEKPLNYWCKHFGGNQHTSQRSHLTDALRYEPLEPLTKRNTRLLDQNEDSTITCYEIQSFFDWFGKKKIEKVVENCEKWFLKRKETTTPPGCQWRLRHVKSSYYKKELVATDGALSLRLKAGHELIKVSYQKTLIAQCLPEDLFLSLDKANEKTDTTELWTLEKYIEVIPGTLKGASKVIPTSPKEKGDIQTFKAKAKQSNTAPKPDSFEGIIWCSHLPKAVHRLISVDGDKLRWAEDDKGTLQLTADITVKKSRLDPELAKNWYLGHIHVTDMHCTKEKLLTCRIAFCDFITRNTVTKQINDVLDRLKKEASEAS